MSPSSPSSQTKERCPCLVAIELGEGSGLATAAASAAATAAVAGRDSGASSPTSQRLLLAGGDARDSESAEALALLEEVARGATCCLSRCRALAGLSHASVSPRSLHKRSASSTVYYIIL